MLLETLQECINYLNESNKSSVKKDRFKELYDSCSINIELWSLIYNYDKLFHITSKNIEKNLNKYKGTSNLTIIELLNKLSSGLTGNNAIREACHFVHSNSQFKDLIYDVIDKELHIGLSVSTMNEIVPNLFKEFKVALAQSIKGIKLDSNYVCSHKLDGCRCIMIAKNRSDIKFYSRQGKEFDTLGNLKLSIQQMFDKGILCNNTVLDGEICIVDEDGKEDFKSIMKEIKRKDHTIQNPMYIVFDRLSINEFNNGTSELGYKDRISYVDVLCNSALLSDIKHIRAVEHFNYTDDEFKLWQQKVIDRGWEGLIARKDVKYENKRTQNMLKIKDFYDDEYKVIDIDMSGDATILVNGKAERVKCIKSLVIEHKGNKVGVGSGLTQEQRLDFYLHPENIIGKIINVRYFEETVDDNGKPSLRFPTIKFIYDGDRDV